jgi:hypothetical protein
MLNLGFYCHSWSVCRSGSLETISLDTLGSACVLAVSVFGQVDFIKLLWNLVISYVQIVSGFNDPSYHLSPLSALKPGLWSWYTKPLTPTPQFLNLRLLHKSSMCINNGIPTKTVNGIIRHFVTTMCFIRLLFRLTTYI